MFIDSKKAFFFQSMSDGKVGGPIEKKSLKHHICSKSMVVGHPKMMKFRDGTLSKKTIF